MQVLGEHSHSFANAVVSITGVAYFAAWSFSFYPQLILNYRRKRTTGLSPDLIIINPIGFLTLTIWNWGVYFSPLAQQQYKRRHDGHSPQISKSDLAFSLHALVISSITLLQVIYYHYKNKRIPVPTSAGDDEGGSHTEQSPLLRTSSRITEALIPGSTILPSVPLQLSIVAIVATSLGSGILVWVGKAEWLDWLYFVSTLKLIISFVKYVPQILLNYQLKSTKGYAIWVILLDLTGSFLSFAQLVVSSVWIEHDPSGIIANPAKLGLSGLSIFFDLIFVVQNYYLYKDRRVKDVEGEE